MCMNLPEMGFLADKNMGLLTNINTVDHAGLPVAPPRRHLASLQGWFMSPGSWKAHVQFFASTNNRQ